MADEYIDHAQVKKRFIEWFITNGFAVFPLGRDSKEPVVKGWQKLSDRSMTEQEKAEYIKAIQEGANYAVPAGQKNLVVLDVEEKNMLIDLIGIKEFEELCRRTLCVETPHGGVHVYFIADEPPPQKFNPVLIKEGKGIADLQSFHSYTVGPGSCINHRFCETPKCPLRGKDVTTCYTPITPTPVIDTVQLRPFLRELARAGKKLGVSLSPKASEWVGDTDTVSDDLDELKKVLLKYHRFHGKTTNEIREEICPKLRRELDRVSAEADEDKTARKLKVLLSDAVPVICDRKTYADIGVTDRSQADWHVLRVLIMNGVTDPDIIAQLLPPDSKVFAPKWDKYFIHTLRKAFEETKPIVEFRSKVKKAESAGELKRLTKDTISEIILSRFKIVTFYQVSPRGEAIIGMYRWNPKKGVYEPFEKRLRKLVRRVAEEVLSSSDEDGTKLVRLSKRDVDDIIDEIRDKTLKEMPPTPLRVAFPNGTVEWDGNTFTWVDVSERTRKHYAFYFLPWTPHADVLKEYAVKEEITVEEIEDLAKRLAPKTLEAFKSWVGDYWITLFQVIGYTLYPAVKYRKAFMLIGKGRNGKSSFITLVKKILGPYASAVPITDLLDSDNRFAVSELFGKLANVASESKDYTIEDVDRFKALVSGDPVSADQKFKDRITFNPVAKLIIASNNFPRVSDTNDEAFWARWLIVQFPNQFPDDDTWFTRTFTDEEINGIITVSLIAVLRAFKQKHFDHEQSVEEVKKIWLAQIDSVVEFIENRVKEGVYVLDPANNELRISENELYNDYLFWCSENATHCEGLKGFTRRLKKYFGVESKQIALRDTQTGSYKYVRVYVGISRRGRAEAGDAEVEDPHGGGKTAESQDRDPELEKLFEENLYIFRGGNVWYTEVVRTFGDKKTADKFIEWCTKHGKCKQVGIDVFMIN